MSGDTEENNRYRLEIEEEIQRRESALQVAKKNLAEVTFALSVASSGKAILAGRAGEVAQQEAYRRALRQRLKQCESGRALREDLDRAKERKQDLE